MVAMHKMYQVASRYYLLKLVAGGPSPKGQSSDTSTCVRARIRACTRTRKCMHMPTCACARACTNKDACAPRVTARSCGNARARTHAITH